MYLMIYSKLLRYLCKCDIGGRNALGEEETYVYVCVFFVHGRA